MGGSSGGGTTITKSEPWNEQKPYLTYGFQQAKDIYQKNGPSYYPNSTVAPLGDTTQQAMQLQTQRAVNGNPLANAGQNALMDTVNGNYLNSNPHLDANFKAGSDAITQAYGDALRGQTASFAGSGSGLNSSAYQFMQDRANDTLAKNLGDLYSQTYYTNYANERQNQLNATTQAPTYANLDYANLDALSNVGAAQDAHAQSLIDADVDKWNYNQNLAANKLNDYLNLIQGNYGSTSSQSAKSNGGSRVGGIASGALSGASMGSAFGPVGTGVGALFGGLAGAFSDRRLKTDIEPIGTAHNGLTIYRYKYLGSNIPQIGFMADEVEKIVPEAVTIDPSGYKRVNYELATMMGA